MAQAFGFGQVRTQAGILDSLLDQAGDMFVGKPLVRGLQPVARHSDEDRAEIDLGIVQPLGQGMDRAGLVSAAAPDLDLAPTGLADRVISAPSSSTCTQPPESGVSSLP